MIFFDGKTCKTLNEIEKYKIKDQTGIHYKSMICSVAGSIGHKAPLSDLDYRINELTQSFFNQWRFIIETYQRLHYLFMELNKCSDIPKSSEICSEYISFCQQYEFDFKNYSYLLIISLKTYLDLFACLIDISIFQIIRKENQLPDFFNLYKNKHLNEGIHNELKRIASGVDYPWIEYIKDARDKIIHRGFHLKPKFGLTKSNELIIQLYQGNNLYTDPFLINISKLFDSFMLEMPIIEDSMSHNLISNIDLLNNEIDLELSYTFGGLYNLYNYRELKPI
jgi:hypothetical protein